MFNLGNILKEAKWIGKISLLQEMQMKNMVGQLFAKYKDKFKLEEVSKEKEKFLGFANKINDEVIKNLKVDFKNEKIVLVWILEQVLNKSINESILEEDLEVIKENLSIYFENKGKINKTLDKINYNELKIIVKDYKEGGEEEKHQQFLSKPEYEGNGYKIYKITKVDECLKIGKGTSWCIQGKKWAKEYLSKGPLYLVTKNNKRYALLSFETNQFMDVNDNRLEKDKCKEIFKFFPVDFLKKIIKTNGKFIQYIENPSKEDQLEAVKQNGTSIQFIKDPSKEVQLEAVRNFVNSIQYIENPDKEVQLEAVKQSGNTIQFIKNPNEEVQLEAVKRNGTSIQYIKNPNEEIQLEAVKRKGFAIQYIKNPSKKTQLEAIKQDAYSLGYIENPDEEVQLEAVKLKGHTIQFIENPSEELQLEAVKQNGSTIQLIKDPSEELQLEAVKQNGDSIYYIKNPSEELQLIAIKQDPKIIKLINNPSKKVLDYVKSLKK